jgi:hypothetical protein
MRVAVTMAGRIDHFGLDNLRCNDDRPEGIAGFGHPGSGVKEPDAGHEQKHHGEGEDERRSLAGMVEKVQVAKKGRSAQSGRHQAAEILLLLPDLLGLPQIDFFAFAHKCFLLGQYYPKIGHFANRAKSSVPIEIVI